VDMLISSFPLSRWPMSAHHTIDMPPQTLSASRQSWLRTSRSVLLPRSVATSLPY
jgi:hypothetical protein